MAFVLIADGIDLMCCIKRLFFTSVSKALNFGFVLVIYAVGWAYFE